MTVSRKNAAREASRLAVAKRIAEAANRPTATDDKTAPPGSSLPLPSPRVTRTNLATVPIELLCSVRDEPTKKGLGYTFYSSGLTAEYGLAVLLNRDRILISKALAKSDYHSTTFFYALLVAENLALRHSQSPFVAALQRELMRQLYPQGFHPFQRFTDLAMRLSVSPLLASLKDLPIYGQAPLDKLYLVATISIEVSQEVAANAPWKRLTRRSQPK
jgi:hypothetical protein